MKTTAIWARGARSLLAALVASLIALVLSGTALTAPSAAHSGGKAIPLVSDFTLTPAATGWSASVAVVDFDSGEALGAIDVQLKGAGLATLTPMVESARTGMYELALPKAKPGPVKLTLQMRTLPGGTEITNLNESYERTLLAGKPLHVAGAAPTGGESGGGSNAGMVVGGAGALLLVAVICTMLALRSRTRAPATAARGH
jgi:hypothetical protein